MRQARKFSPMRANGVAVTPALLDRNLDLLAQTLADYQQQIEDLNMYILTDSGGGANGTLIDDNSDGYTHAVTADVTSVTINLPEWAQSAPSLHGRITCRMAAGTRGLFLAPNNVSLTDFPTKMIGIDSAVGALYGSNWSGIIGYQVGGAVIQTIECEFDLQLRADAKWQFYSKNGGFADGGAVSISNCIFTGYKHSAWAKVTSLVFTANEIKAGSTFEIWAVS